MQAYEVISLLEGTSSKTEKEDIVAQAYHAGCFEFFLGAQYAYDRKVTFGTKHVPSFSEITATEETLQWDDFTVLANMLKERHVTGGDATTAIHVTAEHCNEQMWDGWYRRILLKDLRCGATESTINKALKKIKKAGDKKVEKYMVPVFTCQLAHPRDKYEKLMKGDKLIDTKLDGVRILALCDIDHKTVTICTRNGLVKKNFTDIENLLLTRLIPKLTRSVVLDGEIVSKTFKAMMSQLNRQTDVDTSDAKLAVFDCIPMDHFHEGKSPITQANRDKSVAWACRTINDERIWHIVKHPINLDTPEGMAELDEFHAKATAAKLEGTMVKCPNAPYVTKRSSAWLKIKPWVTVDLKIVGVELGTKGKKYENCLGRMHCEGLDEESGKFIRVSPGEGTNGSMTDQDRIDFWARQDELIGKTVEVLGHEISEDEHGNYSIRHPRFVCFRDDKD